MIHSSNKIGLLQFGHVLEQYIASTGMSLRKFAQVFGCHWKTLQRYIDSETAVDILTVNRLMQTAPPEWEEKLAEAALFSAKNLRIESQAALPFEFLDINDDGTADARDVHEHLSHATLRCVDAQLTTTNKRAGRFDVTEKCESGQRHLQAVCAIQAGA
jgi:hypothetical protein